MIDYFKNKRVILLLLPTLLCVYQQSVAEDIIKESAEETKQYSLPNRDPGQYQSPINIFTTETKKSAKPHKFIINFNDKITAIENLGHTV